MKLKRLYFCLWVACALGAVRAGAQSAAFTSPPAQAASEPDPPIRQGAFVNFNFDQVDLRFLVKLVGDLTGRRFVMDKEIEGKITVVTPPQIPLDEVYPLFQAILEAGGCAVVEREGLYHIVAREKRVTPLAPVIGAGDPTPAGGLITKVMHIVHLNAAEVRKVLEPMVGDGKAERLGVLETTNHLIVTDTVEGIRRLERVIEQIDKPGMARTTEIVALRHAGAQEMANELNQAMAGAAAKAESAGERLKQRLPKPPDGAAAAGAGAMPTDAFVVAAPHSNSLLLVGTPAQLADLKRIIERMDVEPQTGHGRLKAIFLKYLAADEAAKSLTTLLSKNADKNQPPRIAIESSLGNNALLIDAEPQEFEMVRELIADLDRPPQQVLVEVMIAELTLEKGKEIGVEAMAGANPAEGSSVVVGGLRTAEGEDNLVSKVMTGVIPNGLTFGVAKGSYTDSSGNVIPRFPALINVTAVQKDARFNIRSHIPLWTQNNQQANVSVVKNIPILKSTIQGGTGATRDVIQNIERIDVGIKLTVTPHVNPTGDVLMTLHPSIEAIIEEATAGKEFTPTIAKREVTTTLTVPNHETIVISGLISDNEVKKVRKVPILGSIPLIGWLFRHTANTTERSNLLIFVTPHVVTNMAEAAALNERLKAQTGLDPRIRTNGVPVQAVGPAAPETVKNP